MNIRDIQLFEMLEQREKRAEQIEDTKERYPSKSILSFKLNIPGPEKNNPQLLFAFEEGLKLLDDLNIIVDERLNVTGPECILISNLSSIDLKKKMLKIEDEFYLGRLFDLDVLDVDRSTLNIKARKCLICNAEAHVCSRSRKHSLDIVLEKIYEIIEKYQSEIRNDY